MQSYRKQIEQTEQHLQVNTEQSSPPLPPPPLLSSPPPLLPQVLSTSSPVTSADIVAAVQKLHNAFSDLAARYQSLHQALATQKTLYLQLHRSKHGSAAVFETRQMPKKQVGQYCFNHITNLVHPPERPPALPGRPQPLLCSY